ncbi:MAG TPA: phage integrase N-terminal SAM-like domain-containing protein, partial [Gemmatimonadaceae bacterium]|nr:phage integrase N-terminal SAM-like domain-containing protein [Gemmatimonadaceae bacterium]
MVTGADGDGGTGARRPKLLEQIRRACRARHFSSRTEEAYTAWVRRYVIHHGRRHPAELGAPALTAVLTHLAVEHEVSAATQNQAASALLFLYREVLVRTPRDHRPQREGRSRQNHHAAGV